ncbi:MAG: CRTAC1 family protein [Candidatus Marinimicrobia bacterium]|nr:CRTAC1 family protein [Candidatus Neomarinimicrobiota bacterium]MBL7030545.1 CRTAC1 family protein [Candidatus Neomarinimicrobiota bacterium]
MNRFLLSISLCAASSLVGQDLSFIDVAKNTGLHFTHDHGGNGEKFYVETMGSGVCLVDYDNDGDLDIYFTQGAPLPGWDGSRQLTNKLYQNNHGKWIDVTAEAGVGDPSYSIGCACSDVDNDGDTDLYVTNFGTDILYINNGDGTFLNGSKSSGIANQFWSSSAAFFDGDNDGWLDLYVTNYVEYSIDKNPWCGEQRSGHRAYCDPDIFKGLPDQYFHNNGDGTFTDWTQRVGIGNDQGKGLGVVPGDYDNDGDMDLYVANDKVMNLLYVNNGNGEFQEEALFSGIGFNENGRAEAGMGVDFGDINGDGWLDLFVTNFSGESNTLYMNDKNGSFTDKTFSAGLGQPSLDLLGFGTKFVDLNLDGWLDIFIANGHVIDNIALFNKDYSHAQRKQIFINQTDGTFKENKSAKELNKKSVARGAAFGDIDNDGDIDIVISNNNGVANLLINKSKLGNNWINIELEGVTCNRDAIGAKLELKTKSGIQTAWLNPAASYLSSNDKRVVFGIGKDIKIKSLIIYWPDGRNETYDSLKINSFYTIRQGGDISIINQ